MKLPQTFSTRPVGLVGHPTGSKGWSRFLLWTTRWSKMARNCRLVNPFQLQLERSGDHRVNSYGKEILPLIGVKIETSHEFGLKRAPQNDQHYLHAETSSASNSADRHPTDFPFLSYWATIFFPLLDHPLTLNKNERHPSFCVTRTYTCFWETLV